jgi:hypothetical protein
MFIAPEHYKEVFFTMHYRAVSRGHDDVYNALITALSLFWYLCKSTRNVINQYGERLLWFLGSHGVLIMDKVDEEEGAEHGNKSIVVKRFSFLKIMQIMSIQHEGEILLLTR